MNISLNLKNDLTILDHKCQIKISSREGNTLQIRNDGLYAKATSGNDGSDGTGYTKQDKNGVRIGYTNIFNNDRTVDTENGTLCHLTNVVHRFYRLDKPFVEDDTVPSSPDYQRGNCDILLAGDMMFYDNSETNTRDVWMITRVKYSDDVFSNNVVNEDEIHNTDIVEAVKILEGVTL